MVVRSPKKPLSHDAIVHAPFTLFPSPILRSQFNQACQVQTDMNLLFHEVANDPEFLEQCLNRYRSRCFYRTSACRPHSIDVPFLFVCLFVRLSLFSADIVLKWLYESSNIFCLLIEPIWHYNITMAVPSTGMHPSNHVVAVLVWTVIGL